MIDFLQQCMPTNQRSAGASVFFRDVRFMARWLHEVGAFTLPLGPMLRRKESQMKTIAESKMIWFLLALTTACAAGLKSSKPDRETTVIVRES